MKDVSKKRGAADGANDDVEVAPSGQALSIVSGWLGMTAEEALREAGPGSEDVVPVKRPQFLGLGAKYLPHHKAVETATALDHKLRKRLERGMARKQQQQQAEEEGRGPRLGPEEQKAAGPRGGGGLKGLLQQQSRAQGGKGRPGPGRGGDDSDGGDSDGEAKGGGGRAARPAAPAPGSKAAREALLLAAVGPSRKKGKKQKVAAG